LSAWELDRARNQNSRGRADCAAWVPGYVNPIARYRHGTIQLLTNCLVQLSSAVTRCRCYTNSSLFSPLVFIRHPSYRPEVVLPLLLNFSSFAEAGLICYSCDFFRWIRYPTCWPPLPAIAVQFTKSLIHTSPRSFFISPFPCPLLDPFLRARRSHTPFFSRYPLSRFDHCPTTSFQSSSFLFCAISRPRRMLNRPRTYLPTICPGVFSLSLANENEIKLE